MRSHNMIFPSCNFKDTILSVQINSIFFMKFQRKFQKENYFSRPINALKSFCVKNKQTNKRQKSTQIQLQKGLSSSKHGTGTSFKEVLA